MNHQKQVVTLIVRNARLSFAHGLFEPKAVNAKYPEDKSYSCSLIFDKDTQLQILNQDKTYTPTTPAELSTKMLTNAFGSVNIKQKNWAFRSNQESIKKTTGKRYDGFEDDNGFHMGPKRKATDGPPTFRHNNTDISPMEAAKIFYGGCRVDAKVTLVTFAGAESNGLTAFLVAVKFAGHDAPFTAVEDASGLDDGDVDAL